MKAALVVDAFDPSVGGLEKWTVQFAAHLVSRGHEVHVVTFAARETGLDLVTHRVPWRPSINGRASAVADRLRDIGADVVHDSGTGWSADVFHPQTGSRLLSLDREIASHPAWRRLKAAVSPRTQTRRWTMAHLERRQLAGARRVVAVSRRIRDYLAADHAVPVERIAVVANGVDAAHYAPDRIAPFRTEMRARLGVGEAILCLCSAHNLRLKGVDTAIRAIGRLRAAGHDVRLAVAGGAPDAAWRRLAASAAPGEAVRFLGQVDDMARLYAAADIYVHPTRWDACSLSTLEAAAAGLPVITTAVNGASELIDDGWTGLILPDPEDVDALARGIERLLAAETRQRIGGAALAAAVRHGIDANLRAVESVLLSCVRPRP